MSKSINIVWLYPKDMSIYGDKGNILTLQRRLQWHGYSPIITEYNAGDKFPKKVDIIVGGGGQDSGQLAIHKDLLKIGDKLKKLSNDGTPMLMVCGLYQLFGKSFTMANGNTLQGISIFDATTIAKNERLIGNIITTSRDFGDIIGYENHSGQTYLAENMESLGVVRLGAGNNSEDGHEGARYKNVIGTYMHGSLLPKNPLIADFLIEQAVKARYGSFTPGSIDDSFASAARQSAGKRPR